MERIPLLGGAYQSRSIISGAQRCINQFPEINDDQQAPTQVTHFPTPGLTLKGTPPIVGTNRCLYTASNGDLFAVIRNVVYYVSPLYVFLELGQLASNFVTRVVMTDNKLAVLIVDGTGSGYAVNLVDSPNYTAASFAPVNDINFLGGVYASYVDGFFVSNIPATNSWQISLPFVTFANLTTGTITPGQIYPAYDPLDVAAKIGAADNLGVSLVVHRTVFLLGALWSSEAYYNSGAADFPFSIVPGVFFEHGVAATYSAAWQDLSVFFLAQDRFGTATVLRINADYSISQISTRGIEYIVSQMPVISDAVGWCYQQNGHAFYILSFPTANRTFACELKTGQWHELAWTDGNGVLNRHRGNVATFAYGINLVGDWQNGKIYQLDINNYTDFDGPITRLRTIPHLVKNGKRIRLDMVMADLQGGTLSSATPQTPPSVFIRVSTDRGGSFGNAVQSQFGAAGDYAHFPTWRNLGMGRDFVMEVSWSAPINTAFNGLLIRATETEGDG